MAASVLQAVVARGHVGSMTLANENEVMTFKSLPVKVMPAITVLATYLFWGGNVFT